MFRRTSDGNAENFAQAMADTQERIFAPQAFLIPETSPARRIPLSSDVQEGRLHFVYSDYDYRTLIYDCAVSGEGRQVILFAPQLNNLTEYLEKALFVALPSVQKCAYAIKHCESHAQISVDTPAGTTQLHFVCPLGGTSFKLEGGDADFFKGRRVVVTQAKNEEPVWLRDWITYYQRVHGADAALIFDNGSDRYTVEDLQAALSGIPGIARLGIVSWPFPIGTHPPLGQSGISEYYCQYGALETAHWRFLPLANSVLNCDLDELVLPVQSGEKESLGIFEAVEREPDGLIMSTGLWSTLVTDPALQPTVDAGLRHRDFRVTEKVLKRTEMGPKWAVVPAKWPSQWLVHFVHPLIGWDRMPNARATHRHCRQLTTWNPDRRIAVPFDPERHFIDEDLIGALAHLPT